MIKIKLLFFLSLLFINCTSKCYINDKNQIFIILRGTDSKRRLISENFNYYNNLYTHIGIGYKINGKLNIYHILPSPNKTDLIVETLDEFKNVSDLNCIGIFATELSHKSYKNVILFLQKIRNVDIKYDNKFDVSTDNLLYCSEFVIKAINQTKEFNIKPIKKEIPNLYRGILSKDSLSFYPVDILIKNEKFNLIYFNQVNKK